MLDDVLLHLVPESFQPAICCSGQLACNVGHLVHANQRQGWIGLGSVRLEPQLLFQRASQPKPKNRGVVRGVIPDAAIGCQDHRGARGRNEFKASRRWRSIPDDECRLNHAIGREIGFLVLLLVTLVMYKNRYLPSGHFQGIGLQETQCEGGRLVYDSKKLYRLEQIK